MKKLFIISLFAMLPILSEAQESVEEIGPFKDNYSIIRELNQKESLIYNCYQGLSIFTLTYEGTSTIETAAQGYQFQYIRDFEILNGEDVYLCGEEYDHNLGLSNVFLGHFTMTDFHNTPSGGFLNINRVSLGYCGITRTKKLDVFVASRGEVHVVVTGTISPGNECVVDCYRANNTYLNLIKIPHQEQPGLYDDVTVTDNYVVVSSRSTSKSPGSILVFNKPTSGNSVFPSPVSFSRITLPYSVDGGILLEACEQDAFVLACHSAGSNAVYISGFDGTTHLATIGMPLQSNLSPSSQLKDISYSPNNQDLEVLQYELIGSDTASIVYHINPTVLTDPFPVVYGNYYKCQTLCSIVNKKYLDGYTFASGHPFLNCYDEPYNNYKILRKYVLLQGSYGNCTEERATRILLFEKGPSVNDEILYSDPRLERVPDWFWEKGENNVDVICN